MPTQSRLYRAPFQPEGSTAIDSHLAGKLLSIALARGGDYADLFFEYRAAGGLVYDEGLLKGASRGVSMGLGVRVQRGDATGYAYVEELDCFARCVADGTPPRVTATMPWRRSTCPLTASWLSVSFPAREADSSATP